MKIRLLPSVLCIHLYLLAGVWMHALAQTATIEGKILHAKTGDPLPFASIYVNKKNQTTSDSTGSFSFTCEPGRITLEVTLVGYERFEKTLHPGFEERLTVNATLLPKENELDRVVVSGSRNEVKLSKEVMSINSVKPYLIENSNATNLSEVLTKVPGVSVIEGQALIRGGTGWSYNIGSRVMVLLDDMPLIGPDFGDVQWDLLPIEAAENIEVIKGPSSVMYGSSASSGTISVRTGWPTHKPETKVQFYQGISDNPRNKNAIWWERTTQPFTTGSFFSHKQRIRNWDIVASSNLHINRSFIQLNDELRARAYVKTRYRFQQIKGLSAGLNGTFMAKKAGRFFLWKDADSGSLKPFDESTGFDKFHIYSVDPHIQLVRNNYSLGIRYRYYHILRDGEFGAQQLYRKNDAVARLHSVDVHYKHRIGSYLQLSSGLYTSSFTAVGNLYAGNQTGYSGAGYVQAEWNRGRWNAVSGMRYEFNVLSVVRQTQRPLLRFGLNYQATSSTFIRASYGEGFRFPTVVERYSEDEIGGVNVYPNADLKTERGWNAELGVKQGIKLGGMDFNADACIFWMEYDNLIELRFDQYERASARFDAATGQVIVTGRDRLGFMALNLPRSRTAGYEVSLEGKVTLGKWNIRTLSGFTYSYPVDLTADSSLQRPGAFLKSMFRNRQFITESDTDAFKSLVAYRTRKLFKSDIEVMFRKWGIGYSANYMSYYEKMDNTLYNVIPGLKGYTEKAGTGFWVQQVRLSYQFTPEMTIAVLVNNLTNATTSTRPARIDAPRMFTLQLRMKF